MSDVTKQPVKAVVQKTGKRAAVKPPFAAPAVAAAMSPAADFSAPIPPVLPAAATASVAIAATAIAEAPVFTAAAAPVASAPIPDQGTETMATAATAATDAFKPADKVQTMISDAQTRARDAMEKGSKMYEEMGSFTKGNVEAVMASSRVAASGFESLGQDMADYGRRSLEQMTAAFKSFAAVKSPTELFQLQGDYARQAFDGMVAEGSKISEKMLKLAGDVAQPLSSRVAVAAEKIKVGM